LISDLLENYFKPNNCAVLVKHKKFQGHTTQEERWYGTQYNSRAFTSEEFEKWNEAVNGNVRSSLHLPTPNPFIATDFTLHEIPEDWKETHERCRQFGPVAIEKNSIEDQTIQSIYLEEIAPPAAATGEEENSVPAAAEGEEGEEDEAPSGAALVQTSGRNHLVWFLQDSIWKVPKVNVFISLRTGYAYHSPLNITLCELFAETMKENLNESTYYADCADLFYDITQTYHGFDLTFSGYHDKLPILINKTLEEMYRLSNTDAANDATPGGGSDSASSSSSIELFTRLKEKILRSYANSLFLAPYNHCIIGSLMCLEEPRWSNLDKYHALKSVTLSCFQSFCNFILKRLYFEIFITGNITPSQAQELSRNIRQKLIPPAAAASGDDESMPEPLVSALDPIRRSVELNPLVEYHYRQCAAQTNPNELNSAIENTYLMYEHEGYLPSQEVQALIDSTELFTDDISNWNSLSRSAALSFLSHLLTEPCFDQLRTKEQLGYIVHSSPTSVGSQVHLPPTPLPPLTQRPSHPSFSRPLYPLSVASGSSSRATPETRSISTTESKPF
jgi:secreted Zn-dependent insulinase-like peptidase